MQATVTAVITPQKTPEAVFVTTKRGSLKQDTERQNTELSEGSSRAFGGKSFGRIAIEFRWFFRPFPQPKRAQNWGIEG
jgi:hypothetical protein